MKLYIGAIPAWGRFNDARYKTTICGYLVEDDDGVEVKKSVSINAYLVNPVYAEMDALIAGLKYLIRSGINGNIRVICMTKKLPKGIEEDNFQYRYNDFTSLLDFFESVTVQRSTVVNPLNELFSDYNDLMFGGGEIYRSCGWVIPVKLD